MVQVRMNDCFDKFRGDIIVLVLVLVLDLVLVLVVVVVVDREGGTDPIQCLQRKSQHLANQLAAFRWEELKSRCSAWRQDTRGQSAPSQESVQSRLPDVQNWKKHGILRVNQLGLSVFSVSLAQPPATDK